MQVSVLCSRMVVTLFWNAYPVVSSTLSNICNIDRRSIRRSMSVLTLFERGAGEANILRLGRCSLHPACLLPVSLPSTLSVITGHRILCRFESPSAETSTRRRTQRSRNGGSFMLHRLAATDAGNLHAFFAGDSAFHGSDGESCMSVQGTRIGFRCLGATMPLDAKARPWSSSCSVLCVIFVAVGLSTTSRSAPVLNYLFISMLLESFFNFHKTSFR